MVGVAACLGDEAIDRVGEESESLGTDGEPATAAAIALPPGAIIDTQPQSGWTEGRFSVSADGAAEYHLPLWVPDGRGGLEPNLALHYNSNSGNTSVGVGWSLSGLSSIHPCSRTLAADGRIEHPIFWGHDAFCLDGQRLRTVSSPEPDQLELRTEQDTFSRIVAYGSEGFVAQPNHFKVWTKDGRILTFGGVPNAQLRARALSGIEPEEPELVPSAVSVIAEWALSRIEDRNGNAVAIEYDTIESEADRWSVEFLPRRITYGPDRIVEFQYLDRPDPIDGFRPGRFGSVHTRIGRKLAKVRMLTGTALRREYRLDYNASSSITGRSLLTRVTECDGAAVCLNPLEFEWSPGSYDFDIVDLTGVTDVGAYRQSSYRFTASDFNGDGRDDLFYRDSQDRWTMRFSNGASFGAAQTAGLAEAAGPSQSKMLAIDYDADGKTDILEAVHYGNGSSTKYALFRSTGTGFSRYGDDLFDTRVIGGENHLGSAYFADLDGNGLADYLVPRNEEEELHWSYRLNSGNGFDALVETDLTTPSVAVFNQWTTRVLALDGLEQGLVYWKEEGEGYGLAKFEGTMAEPSGHLNLPFLRDPENTDRRSLHYADINGDGLRDAIYPYSGLTAQLSSGLGFSDIIPGPSNYLDPALSPGFKDYRGVRIVDFNNDGADDVLILHPGAPTGPNDYQRGMQLYTWRGGGFVRIPLNRAAIPAGFDNGITHPVQPLDFNGDGQVDIAQLAGGSPNFLRLLKRKGGIPDRLVRVAVGGVGDRVEIDYTTLADASVHAPAVDNCEVPVVCPCRGGSIVSRHRLANGLTAGSPWHEFTHDYGGARVDLRGRGWLGFERRGVRDSERPDAVTTAFFDNHTRAEIPLGDGEIAYVYPYAGQPYKVLRTVTSGIVNGSLVTYEHTTDTGLQFRQGGNPGTWVRRIQSAAVADRERIGAGAWTNLHSSTTTFNEYDAFENVKRLTTVVPGSDRVDVVTYDNDTVNWLIGLPSTRATTSCTRPDNRCQTRSTSFDHDPNGNLEEIVVEPGDQDLRLTTTIDYGSFGNIGSVSSSDAAGETRTTSFTYDSQGLYPRTTTNPIGHTSSVNVHPGLGVVLDSQDANGIVPATMKYDRFGRLRELNRADGWFERYVTFGPLAHLIVIPDGNGGTITAQTTILDALGRPTDRTFPAFDGGSSSVRTTYDRFGRLATVSRPYLSGSQDPLQNTRYTYDFRDRLLTMVEPDEVTARHEYIGRDTHTYDRRNIHSYVVERLDGRVEARFEDDPKSTGWLVTRFDYGPFGLLRGTTAADETTQSMQYDVRGRRIQHVDPSAGTTTSVYNAFGELRHETNGNGEETDVQIHDLLGRPWRISSPDGLTTFTWDKPRAVGKLDVSTQNDTNGHYVITRYTYDDIGRNTRTSWEIDNDSFFEVDAGYDSIGRLASITYPRIPFEPEALSPARMKVSYAYHPAGYLESAIDAATGTVYWQADSRQPDGQLTQETFGNGVVGIREYQPETGLLETLTMDGPGGLLDQIGHVYDENRNLRFRDDDAGTGARSQSFLYDSLDRLQTWTHRRADGSDPVTTVFDHDRVGNLLSETVTGRAGRNITYRYGQNGAPRHALTMRNGQSYNYDGAGRRTSGAALSSITYNRRNLPIRMQRSGGGTTELAYDAAGARVLKQTGNTTLFSIAGLFERQLGNQIRNQHYIVAEGREVAQVALIQQVPEGPVTDTEIRYIHADGQGSSALVTNEAGATLAELFYDPYGRRTDRNYDPLAGMVPVRPGYTGHRHDDELAHIDMNGRVYDVDGRRFLTPDPFLPAPLFSQSHNRYSYVFNNPATLVDPTGFDPIIISREELGGISIGGVFGGIGSLIGGLFSGWGWGGGGTALPRDSGSVSLSPGAWGAILGGAVGGGAGWAGGGGGGGWAGGVGGAAGHADDTAYANPATGSGGGLGGDVAPGGNPCGNYTCGHQVTPGPYSGTLQQQMMFPEEASDAFGLVTAFGWLIGENNAWAPGPETETQSRMSFGENAARTAIGAAMLGGVRAPRLVPLAGASQIWWPRISPVAPDWTTKGAHILSGGIELAVRPANNAAIVFRPVFSRESPAAVNTAIATATRALEDVGFRQRLFNASSRALTIVDGGRAAELRRLMAALEKMGI